MMTIGDVSGLRSNKRMLRLLAGEPRSFLPPGEGQGEGYDLENPGDAPWLLTDHLGSLRDLAVYDEALDQRAYVRSRPT